MMYPVRTIVIPGYDWNVKIHETSLYDIEELQSLLTDETGFTEKIMSFITGWNCVDRHGVPVPLTPQGLKRLPQSAVRFIIDSLREPFRDDGLKNASVQSAISEPKAVEKLQNVTL